MTDRELLEFAAVALGVEVATAHEHGLFLTSAKWWNPLADDGDALRLAVKIRACVNVYPTRVCVTADGGFVQVMSQEANYDLAATTRRAIVRAAAEIGRPSK